MAEIKTNEQWQHILHSLYVIWNLLGGEAKDEEKIVFHVST
jgi:hypothetical protein